MARAVELRTSSERGLFAFSLIISILVWLAAVLTVVGALYAAFIGLFLFVAHALMIAYIKGNAVRVTPDQFPSIHRRLVEASRKLGLDRTPAAYVMQAGGALNAFATKFVGRDFIVIYSDLLEACDEKGKEADMIIGHEIGHLALGHLRWLWFLMPARLFPWLGPAYSRACEYSCDLCGYEAAGDFGAAARGIAILAAGRQYGPQVNLDAFVKQAEDTRGFWTSVYELNASHPFLPKRVAALVNYKNPGAVPDPGRHPLAYLTAPMFNFGSGAAPGVLVMVAVVGILAAIAIPQFAKYRERAQQAAAGMEQTAAPDGAGEQVQPILTPEQEAMDASLHAIHAAAVLHQTQTGAWPCSMDEVQLPDIKASAAAKQWALMIDCSERLAAVLFPVEGQKQRYRVLYFDSGQITEGEVKE